MDKWIYYFSANFNEGDAGMQNILGGKGAGLAAMAKLGLPIPPGFTISADICEYYYTHNHILPLNFKQELVDSINYLEQMTGKVFGGNQNPLLLSIRSGARVSMPGMMDTILNLGMNDMVMEALASVTNNRRFALDSYRRFLEMYSTIVLNIPSYLFEDVFELQKEQANINKDSEIKPQILENIILNYKNIIEKYSKVKIPEDPFTQLISAIEAVLKSWMNQRAIIYRKLNNIAEDFGTAVNIQSMVFGNMNNNSATGVVFTRCPSNGEKKIFGEYLVNAQGEDVVSGIRTPFPISSEHPSSLQKLMPDSYYELENICRKLEEHYKDVQDIEFTIENGRLYILQTRSAKRTTAAAIKNAVDMTLEGILSKKEALMRVNPDSLNQLLHTAIDYSKELLPIAIGLPASPGAATGIVAFSPYDAEEMAHHHKVILVRNDTSPEDIKGMHIANGILTARGGMTSHAAVVARGMGKPCVCGVSGIIVDETKKFLKAGEIVINSGDEITIDGSTGKVFLGKVPLIQPIFSNEFNTILEWADEERTLAVRANAETSLDTAIALKFGAEGIGLCRTEHMFFDNEKIPLVREMIIAPDFERRMKAINKLLPLQINDFKALFKIMNGKPINIRLLDPPLHEFLPVSELDKEKLAESLNLPLSVIDQRLHALHEVNPMLGHRGCRLGITYPEIYKMQLDAIFTARENLTEEEGIHTQLEIMIPLISNVNELRKIKELINDKATSTLSFSLGTMIELPRAALKAGEIAKEVNYFSFGTNDLTQTTYGISRDDIASFLPDYIEQKIIAHDPFVTIDEDGVGELIKIACERGKRENPNLKLGVCGEHAGNPMSIDFFHKIGINYISCSPYRIPIARLAAAQAKIKYEKQN